MFRRSFQFGRGRSGCGVRPADGTFSGEEIISVTAEDLYCAEKGYGFVVEKNRREQDLLQLPELNSAFDTVYWYQNEDLTHVEEDKYGCFLDSNKIIESLEEEAGEKFAGEHRRIPLSFKMDVPRWGNYRVTVTIRVPETESESVSVSAQETEAAQATESGRDVLIFTGRRRLGFRGNLKGCVPMEDGNALTCTMMVNVCDIIPRGHTEVYTDRTIDITVAADRPGISEILVEEAECPTLFIAGDSTVTDQSADYPYAPGASYSGWGQMISGYLNEKTAVSNHAHSGLTTASFRQEGHYDIMKQYIRPGDYALFQFGHNDQKLEELKAEEGYREHLLCYIRECRDQKAFPVLVTPIARNTWKGNDGSYNDLLDEYAQACIRAGEQENVPVIDLHRRSMDFILGKGLEDAKTYFFPGDYTHSNDYGAYYMAGLAASEIKKVCGMRKEPEYRFLAGCVTQGFGSWEPDEKIAILVKPAKYESVTNPYGMDPLADVENLSEPADRASVLDMIIKTVRFFPTNVYNDMFTDVVGHEWYAGTVECAWQNGMIDEGLVENGKFFPLRPVTLEEFLILAVNGYRSRRAIPDFGTDVPERECIYDGKCREFAKPYVRAACSLGLIAPDGGERLDRVPERGEAVALCRKLGQCIG